MRWSTSTYQLHAGNAKNLILRDQLAIDRTRLANERTLLAWWRTALMMLVSGITLLKLFEGNIAIELIGGALIPVSLLTASWGTYRFWRTRASIKVAVTD